MFRKYHRNTTLPPSVAALPVEIREVLDKAAMRQFVEFPLQLYKDNPYAVPELVDEEMMTLDKTQNPAFDFCEARYFLAYKGERVVGRIAGIINHRANETWNQQSARFGFVDFINDDAVVDALFTTVEEWARSMGCDMIIGPMGFTDMDHEGMLVEGFDQLSTMNTIYNYPYYPQQVERIGYRPDVNWKEYKIYVPAEVPEKHRRIADIVRQKYGLKVMKFRRKKDIYPYAHQVFETLNAAYAHLYGYSELSAAQIDYYVKMYIPMLRLDLITVIVREQDQKVIGFGITMPNLSRALQKAKGRLFPFGAFHLLKALKCRPKVVDLYLIGIRPEYQNKGVNALIFEDLIPVLNKYKVEYVESNPELETNLSVQLQWNYFQKVHHKTRRAYVKQI